MNSVKFKRVALAAFIFITQLVCGQSLNIPHNHLENRTFEYPELMRHYVALDSLYENAKLVEIGISDEGLPIHVFLMIKEGQLTQENISTFANEKLVLAVNNGIHPGESCGVDASLHLANDLLTSDVSVDLDWGKTMIAIVPMYNIGGALNRGCCTRANQNGPADQGFRGNARNFDLNRDLIKADTRNTFALYELFRWLDPDIFIDTHTTNGADYTYELTLITSPWQKYPLVMQNLVREIEDSLMIRTQHRDVKISPFVNVYGQSPLGGFPLFQEGAMYTTGFAALHNSIAFVTEAHMLKPYALRVEATRTFLEEAIQYGNQNVESIKRIREQAKQENFTRYVIEWEVDYTQSDTIWFEGFESSIERSDVTTGERLKYTEEVLADSIPFYNRLKPKTTIAFPEYYYIPVGQWEVLTRFQAVGVQMDTIDLQGITSWYVRQFRIDSYQLASRAYEGHVRLEELDVSLDRLFIPDGRYVLIPSQQPLGRYLHQALHPLAPSSFARWNMFAAYLQQKEHYSAYVFEDIAEELLEEDVELKEAFERKMESDRDFANDPRAQLYYIYQLSPYYERAHLRLPYYLSYPNL